MAIGVFNGAASTARYEGSGVNTMNAGAGTSAVNFRIGNSIAGGLPFYGNLFELLGYDGDITTNALAMNQLSYYANARYRNLV